MSSAVLLIEIFNIWLLLLGHYGGPDAVLAHQFPVNANRDRWVKYNHPKGAPDADVVFGTHR